MIGIEFLVMYVLGVAVGAGVTVLYFKRRSWFEE